MLRSLYKIFHLILISTLSKCWLSSLLKAVYTTNLSRLQSPLFLTHTLSPSLPPSLSPLPHLSLHSLFSRGETQFIESLHPRATSFSSCWSGQEWEVTWGNSTLCLPSQVGRLEGRWTILLCPGTSGLGSTLWERGEGFTSLACSFTKVPDQ